MNNDMVNHPPHYNQGRYEVIDLIENYFPDNYHLGNALKYLLRCAYKGEQEQDIKKMIWYAERYLEQQTNVGKDLGYNAWSCRSCQQGTNLVDSNQMCSDCRNKQDEEDKENLSDPFMGSYPKCGNCSNSGCRDCGMADNTPLETSFGEVIVSKAPVSPSKASEVGGKVIPPITATNGLGARTERQRVIAEHGKSETAEMIRREEYRRESRRVFGNHNIPKNDEQLTLWELAQYD